MAKQQSTIRRSHQRTRKARHKTSARITPYQWLGAGAITLGIGAAALAGGSGVAYADEGSGAGSAAASNASSAKESSPGSPHRNATAKSPRKRGLSSAPAGSAITTPATRPHAAGNVQVQRSRSAATPQPTRDAPTTPGDDVTAALAAAVTTRRDAGTSATAGTATGQTTGQTVNTEASAAAAVPNPNPPGELAREREAADMNMSVGWVPGVGTVFNAMNLASDAVDFAIATLKGDVADMRDEIGDMTLDVVGMIPVIGAPLSATIYRATAPVQYVAPPPVVDQQHPYTVDGIDPDTGKITAHFNVTHDKPVTYQLATAPDPTLGTFELDEQTGEWTFTPNPRTRVLAGTFEPNSPAAVKLSFAVVATDGEATTAPIVVSEHIAGTDRAALALPAGTTPVMSFVDPRTGDAYVIGYRGDLIDIEDQGVSYLAAIIHSDGSYRIPAGGPEVSGLPNRAFVSGDTVYLVTQTGDYQTGTPNQLTTLGPDGLTAIGDPFAGYVETLLTVGGITYLVTRTESYEEGYQTHLNTVGPNGVTSTRSIPGSFSDRKIVVGDTTYLLTHTGTYESGYQTHLTALGLDGVGSTTSIPGQFYEDSAGYSVVKGDITYLVTMTGDDDSDYETHLTALGPDGVAPTMSLPGWSWNDPTVVGDTTYLLVPTQSGTVTHVVALTSGGATSVGSIPGVLSGDPIVVGDTTYFISHIGDSGAANTWQTVVTTLAPTPGGITVIGDPIPGYRWAMRPLVVGDTTYLVTESWNSSVGYETHLTALQPDGVAPVGTAILGTVSGNPVVVTAGETSYLITTAKYYWNSDGTYAYTRTFLTAVQPDGLTRWGDPIPGYPGSAPITIGNITYLVMETDDSPAGYQLQLVAVTPAGLTPIGNPLSGRVSSHNDVDVVTVGDTTYLMVEATGSTGGQQTTLVAVGPDGLTTRGVVTGHPSRAPIVVGDTTYLVTQTGEYESAQTYFTALRPDGVVQPPHVVAGSTAAYDPTVVSGNLTYVKSYEWENTGVGSYSTVYVHFTSLTPDGPVTVGYPIQYGEQTIIVGDTTYLIADVWPDDDSMGTDRIRNFVTALTPNGPVQLAELMTGTSWDRIVVGDTTYLVYASYPDDIDGPEDVTTYIVTLTPDGPVLADPFPGMSPFAVDGMFTVGDTTYMVTTSGLWAVGRAGGLASRDL